MTNKPQFLLPTEEGEDTASWSTNGAECAPTPVSRSTNILNHKQKMIAGYLASEKSLDYIVTETSTSMEALKTIVSMPMVIDEVARIKDKKFRAPVDDRLESLADDAVDIMEEVLHAPDELVSLAKRENTARWILEKVTGKAAQQLELKGDVSVGVFLEQLKQMEPKDVTPQVSIEGKTPDGEPTIVELNPMKDWVDKNV